MVANFGRPDVRTILLRFVLQPPRTTNPLFYNHAKVIFVSNTKIFINQIVIQLPLFVYHMQLNHHITHMSCSYICTYNSEQRNNNFTKNVFKIKIFIFCQFFCQIIIIIATICMCVCVCSLYVWICN